MDGLYFWNLYKEYKGIPVEKLCDMYNVQLRMQWYDFDTEAFFMCKYRIPTKIVLTKNEDLTYPELWREHQLFHAIVSTVSKKRITRTLRSDYARYWAFQIHVDRCAVALLTAYYGVKVVTNTNAERFFNMGLPHIYSKREALLSHYMIEYLTKHRYASTHVVQESIKNLEMCIAFNQME